MKIIPNLLECGSLDPDNDVTRELAGGAGVQLKDPFLAQDNAKKVLSESKARQFDAKYLGGKTTLKILPSDDPAICLP